MGAYQLKITIKGSKPPIWRRILIPEGITFLELHQMIQTAFGWSDARLYQFEFRSEGVRAVPAIQEESGKYRNILCSGQIDPLVSQTKKFTYTYDLDCKWDHVIEMEQILEDRGDPFAQVIKYKGNALPEDCGGIMAYYGLLESGMETGRTEEYNMEEVNDRLKSLNAPSLSNGSGAPLLIKSGVSLKEIYDCYDKNSIGEIAGRHGMSGYAMLTKEELIESVTAHILNETVMRNYFLCVRDVEMQLFQQLLEGGHRLLPLEAGDMDYLYAGGYVTAGADHSFLVSAEVKASYETFNTDDFQAQRSRLSKISDYLCAANSLYAITPVAVVLGIFNKYEETKLETDELLEAYETLLPYRSIVKYVDSRFVDMTLAEQDNYGELYQVQKKVPYYIPTQPEIRFMADHSGFLMTAELEQLASLLAGELKVDAETIPYVLRQIQAEISLGGSMQSVMKNLEASGIVFQSKNQTKEFSNMITKVWNHTRMVLNRGYQPYEMAVNGLEAGTLLRKSVRKTYPNDPCPCGSGKKYKKCCGK